MAIKNLLNSDYAVVDGIAYDKKGRNLSFNLILYDTSAKTYELNRLFYNLNGNLEVIDTGGVITTAPAVCNYEEEVADFDFDLYKSYKSYIIGSGSKLGREGYMWVCENPPQQDQDGNYPFVDEEVEVTNPDFEEFGSTMTVSAQNQSAAIGSSSPEGGTVVIDVPEKITINRIKTLPLKYDWGALSKKVDGVVFKDPAGKYFDVTKTAIEYPNSYKVREVKKPFTSDEWDKWFGISVMDAKDINIMSQVYSWLDTQAGFEDTEEV